MVAIFLFGVRWSMQWNPVKLGVVKCLLPQRRSPQHVESLASIPTYIIRMDHRMSTLRLSGLLLVAALILPTLSSAEDTMTQLSLSDPSRWGYFSDQVMGGVSQGQASFEQSGGQTVLRLTGMVSTANDGGSIKPHSRRPRTGKKCGFHLVILRPMDGCCAKPLMRKLCKAWRWSRSGGITRRTYPFASLGCIDLSGLVEDQNNDG